MQKLGVRMTNSECIVPPQELAKAVTILWWIYWLSVLRAAIFYLVFNHTYNTLFPSFLGYYSISFGNLALRIVAILIFVYALSSLCDKLLDGKNWARFIVLAGSIFLVFTGLDNNVISINFGQFEFDLIFVVVAGLYIYVLKLLFLSRGRNWFRKEITQSKTRL